MSKIRLSLDVTPQVNSIIDNLAKDNGITKAEVLRRSIAFYDAISKGRRNGEEPAMIKGDKIIARLVDTMTTSKREN